MKKTDEKPLRYCLTVETSSGRCQIATDNWQILINLIDPFASIDKNFQDIKTAAKRAQIAYHQSHTHDNNQSPIAQDDDLEIEVISCYLKGWGIFETTDWLNKKGHKVSKSGIGRYWTRLRKIGIFRMYKYKDKKPLKQS
jgi:hypothetical protein